MRSGAPGVPRQRFETPDSLDARNRLVCTYRSTRYRAEGLFAVGGLQVTKCFRAVFKLDHCLLGWRSIRGDSLLRIKRLDWGSLSRVLWQGAHFTGYQDRVSHCIRA